MPSVPSRFEDDYPKAAQFLQDYYAENHKFYCPRGHAHQLPYFLHCGKDYCSHISLSECKDKRPPIPAP